MKPELDLHNDCDAHDAPASLAGYLLTAERMVMGFVLLGFGVSGLLNLVPDAALPAGANAVGGVMMQVGFAYPLLKGIEVLLELCTARAARAKGGSTATVRASGGRALPGRVRPALHARAPRAQRVLPVLRPRVHATGTRHARRASHQTPQASPAKKPMGPVMKMSKSGTWLACGVTTSGPK